MRIEKRKIDELIPAIYNPRKDLTIDDAEYKKIKRSIETFGYVDPIIVNERTGVIVGGHQRLKVLKDLGYEEIEVSVVDLDEQQEKALNVALNKISGEWDFELLKDLLEELDDGSFDLELTGFDMDEIEDLMTQYFDEDDTDVEVTEDEFDVEEAIPEEPITKRGDIWQLGRHRLMCGDSTNKEDVERLMNGEKADLILTDPPYNVAVNDESEESLKARNRRTDGLKIQNDKLKNDDFVEFLNKVFANCHDVMKDGASIYVFYADSETINFMSAFINAGFHFAQNCIWNKQQFVMTRKDYHYKHEPILYGWKLGAAHNWYADRKQSSVWDFDRPFKSELHPTMKPIPLLVYPIRNSSKKNDIVVDLFGGSGSTLIACEQTGRINYSMELDEKYCDVIIKRWEEFTGKQAVKIT